LRIHQLRRALLCVALAAGLASASSAEASRRVTIKSGDSIDSLARRYGVSTRDIARANRISVDAVLIDGRILVIPDPPETIVRPATMRRRAAVAGNRIAVRRGPGESHRRITLLDDGAALLVTRRAGDWLQVKLEDGTPGWVRGDFVRILGDAGPERTRVARAAHSAAPRANRESPRVRRSARREEPRRRRSARAESAATSHHRRSASPAPRRARRTATLLRRGSRPGASAPEADNDVIRTAYAYRGVRYRYGGSSRGGFDCSGFTSHVYARKGVRLPHSAAAQFQHGRRVAAGEMKPGDLVFFTTTRRGISHVGIYAGNGKFVHASSGGGRVQVDSLASGYYKERFRGARRVK